MITLKVITHSESTDYSDLPDVAKDAVQQTLQFYKVIGFNPPWCSYLVYDDQVCVGTCAFKGAPNAKNEVEIAYFCFPEFEGRGYATQMAKELIIIASKHPTVMVTAQTLPEKNASTRILEKNGFTLRGTAQDNDVGEVWDWVLTQKN